MLHGTIGQVGDRPGRRAGGPPGSSARSSEGTGPGYRGMSVRDARMQLNFRGRPRQRTSKACKSHVKRCVPKVGNRGVIKGDGVGSIERSPGKCKERREKLGET